jgi:hypothetical protein
LFLLAVLAQEYSNIQRLVIVRNDSNRVFVGMVSPAVLRQALSTRYPELEGVLARIRANNQALGDDPRENVQVIGGQWSWQSFGPGAPNQIVSEQSFRQLISHKMLNAWLGAELETDGLQWTRTPGDKELYRRILHSENPYVPLLQGRRLAKIVDRQEFAQRVAAQAVS